MWQMTKAWKEILMCVCVCVSLWGVDWFVGQDSDVIVLSVFDREDFLAAGCLPAALWVCVRDEADTWPAANDLQRGGHLDSVCPRCAMGDAWLHLELQP